jgi:hypothetical protein
MSKTLSSPDYRSGQLRRAHLEGEWPVEGLCAAPQCARRHGHAGVALTPEHKSLCLQGSTARHNAFALTCCGIIGEARVGDRRRENADAFRVRPVGSGPSQRLEPVGRGDLVVIHSRALATGDAELDGKHWILDFSIGNPAATKYREHAWREAGYTAAAVERHKHLKYRTPGTRRPPPRGAAGGPLPAPLWQPDDCLYASESYVLLPFVAETHGRLGATAERVLLALAVHAAGGPDGDKAERCRLFRRWRTLLSVAVTRAVSVQVTSHSPAAHLVGGPAPRPPPSPPGRGPPAGGPAGAPLSPPSLGGGPAVPGLLPGGALPQPALPLPGVAPGGGADPAGPFLGPASALDAAAVHAAHSPVVVAAALVAVAALRGGFGPEQALGAQVFY